MLCFFVLSEVVRAALAQHWVAIPIAVAFFGTIALIAFRWGPRTEVTRGGVRITWPPRTQEVTWDQVKSVESPGRWELARDVRVRLEDGRSLSLPGLPGERWAAELDSYWRAHRSVCVDEADAPEKDDGGR